MLENPDLSEEVKAYHKARLDFAQPMGRMGTGIEIANLILYLASTESSFTSGAWVSALILVLEMGTDSFSPRSEHIIDGAMNTTAGYAQNPWNPIPSPPAVPANGH
jgi:NAD(P)-dependent dehydrogenase (short-subunit alcohol dehydrogenase family)